MSRIILNLFVFLTFVAVSVPNLFSQQLPKAKPGSAQMSSKTLDLIDGLVEEAIAEKKMPGAVVLVGRKGKIVFRKAYGKRALVPASEEMTVDTIFDLASLTKPIATATAIMILMEQGKIRLTDTIGEFIPDIEDENAKKVTIQQLLTHTSGYGPDFDLAEQWNGREGMLGALKMEKLRNPAGLRFVYSDIGFIVLGEIVERLSKKTLDVFVKENQLRNLLNTTFIRYDLNKDVPNSSASFVGLLGRIAPTENICGQQSYLGGKPNDDCGKSLTILRGQVHDPTSWRMNGVAGHAGLYSTADDLAKYCQMILDGGSIDGKRVLSGAAVAKMTKPYVISETGETRGLGWDINTSFSSNRGELFPLGSFGHTGFTGTGIWIDPLSETFVIFLSNRVHPDGKGDIVDVRAKISTVAASAVTDITPDQIRDFEAKYYARINAHARYENQRANNKTPVQSTIKVLNGIDVLEKDAFKPLGNLRIGLVTNQTGRNRAGKSTIDVLGEAKMVRLVSLFSPEHGIRGQLDQQRITDSKDEKTGLPIYSLYGESRRPSPEQLNDLDALVFDIQDIGTRFYTYISTLRYVLEEAAKAKKKVFVLDRPNPINGVSVEGPVADESGLSFVATHTLPVRHGMTIGEIALMLNQERKIEADLEVIKMQHWQRDMWFDETNQTWINPSPNMRSLNQATLYPGIGLLETTNLSVGRGTDTPFEILGAPWIDGQNLAFYLNQKNLPGVRFIPVEFTPDSSVFKNQVCRGINISITDRKTFSPVRAGLEIALTLRALYPQGWKFDNYNRLLANAKTFEFIKENKSVSLVDNIWIEMENDFKSRRSKFFLYK